MYVVVMPKRHRRWMILGLGILMIALLGKITTGPVGPIPAAGRHHPLREAPSASQEVALTFNLYWGEEVPGAVLDILKESQVTATFFVTGPWARAHPDVARRIVDEGHQLGNGGYNYVNLTEYGREFVREQLEKGERALTEVTGVTPKVFRPPGGDYDDQVLAQAREMGYRVVLWSLDSHDWMNPGTDHILSQVKDNLSPGAVLLFHANDPPGDTLPALEKVIDLLREREYRMVTVEALFGARDTAD